MSELADIPGIKVRNLQGGVRVDAKSLEKFAQKALPLCLALRKGKKTDLRTLREIFVLIISDRRMASLHRKFLKKSGPTDVITFSHGEIFISAETARRHARQFGNSLMREVQLYIVHGLLHLHGFDDRDKTGSRKMKAIQRRILGECQRVEVRKAYDSVSHEAAATLGQGRAGRKRTNRRLNPNFIRSSARGPGRAYD